MDIRSGDIQRSLNSAGRTGSSDVRSSVKPGDLLMGRVSRALGAGRYQVSLRGQSLILQSSTTLTAGSGIALLVEQVTDRIFARLAGKTGGTQTNSDLKAVLKELGLPDTAQNRSLLGKLLKHDMVVNRERLLALKQLIGRMPQGSMDQKLDMALLVMLKSLPQGERVFTMLFQVLYNSDQMPGLLAGLKEKLQKYLEKDDISDREDVEKILTLLEGLEKQSFDGISRPDMDFGLYFEDRILKDTAGLKDNPDLLYAVLWLKERFSEDGDDGDLYRLADSLQLYLEGMKMLSGSGPGVTEQYVSIPGHTDTGVFIRTEEEPDGSRKSLLRFCIQTENMGRVSVSVRTSPGNADCRFTLADDSIADHFAKGQDSLQERLEEVLSCLCTIHAEAGVAVIDHPDLFYDGNSDNNLNVVI